MLASAKDVQQRFNRELDEELMPLIDARLKDAETKIRRRIPDLDARIEADPLLTDVVVQVCADAVIRLIRNPDGYVQETDGNYTYMLSNDFASARLTILPEEWADLGWKSTMRVVHVLPNLPWVKE